MGGGKTTFVRGLARGFGSKDVVSSPSFTIKQVYKTGDKAIHHYDFYRLAEPGIVASELAEDVGDPAIVSVIEWAGIVRGVLPTERLSVTLTKIGDTSRELAFTFPEQLTYFMKGIKDVVDT